jgi:hypothetical protein
LKLTTKGGFYGDPYDIGFGPGQFTPPTQSADIQGMAPDQFERFTGQQPMFTGEGSLAPENFQPFADSFQPLQTQSPAETLLYRNTHKVYARHKRFSQASLTA